MMMGGPFGRHGAFNEEARKAKDSRATLTRLLRYFAPYKVALLGVAAFIVLGTVTQIASPFLTGQAVDCFIAPSANSRCALSAHPAPDLSGLMMVAVLMVVVAAVDAVGGGLQFFLMANVGQRVVKALRDESFDQVHRLSVRYFTEHEAGDVMSRLTNDVDTISQAVNFGLVRIVSSLLSLVGIVVAMVVLNAALAFFSLLVVPAMLVVTQFLSNRARRAFRQSRLSMGDVNADLQESIAGVSRGPGLQSRGREHRAVPAHQ